MEIIPDKKIGAGTPEEESQMSVELARIISSEAAELGVSLAEKMDEKPSRRRKAGIALLLITFLASAMVSGMPSKAKAGEGFHFGQRAAEIARQWGSQAVSDASNRGNQVFNAQLDAERKVFDARLDMEKQAIQRQIDDRNQVRQLNMDQIKQEIQQINNRINTYEQVKVEAIKRLGDPKSDAKRQIDLCESEIKKLEQKRAAYLGAATGISPVASPQMSPGPGYAPPPPPQMRPRPDRSLPPSPPSGQWRPIPPQSPPPPPQMRPRQNRPAPPSPPPYSDERPLPPLPDL